MKKRGVDYHQHGQVVSFIWNIADDVPRGSLKRTKYHDVILPHSAADATHGSAPVRMASWGVTHPAPRRRQANGSSQGEPCELVTDCRFPDLLRIPLAFPSS